MWLNGLSDDDRKEMYQDASAAFQAEYINEKEYREALVKLGYNATDIEEAVRFYRPTLENSDGEGQ